MNSDNLILGLEIYTAILLVFFLGFYFYYFYKTVSEGKDRDLGLLTLIAFSILLSPFMAYAFVKSTIQDSDRIKAKIKSNEETEEVTLTHIIKEKIPTDRIVELKDINQTCRECKEYLREEDKVCPNCRKKRVWYSLYATHDNNRIKCTVGLSQWKNIPEGFLITKVKRNNTPQPK